MALTDAQICTLGLLKVGETSPVDNLATDTTAQAAICRALYGASRDSLLEMVPWPFATRRAPLALTTATRNDWTYVYSFPTDCLAPRFLENGLQNAGDDQQIPFEVEDDATDGKVLVTDLKSATLVYTRAVTETGKFSSLFCEALSWKLAYELCFAIPVKTGFAERMMQGFQGAFATAAASAFNHQKSAAKPTTPGIRARY